MVIVIFKFCRLQKVYRPVQAVAITTGIAWEVFASAFLDFKAKIVRKVSLIFHHCVLLLMVDFLTTSKPLCVQVTR